MGHARALAGLEDVLLQLDLLHEILSDNLSVREVERRIASLAKRKPKAKKKNLHHLRLWKKTFLPMEHSSSSQSKGQWIRRDERILITKKTYNVFLIYCNNRAIALRFVNKLSLAFMFLLASSLQAQDNIEENIIDTSQSTQDSILTLSEESIDDSFHPKDFKRAILWASTLPGAGQAYNEKYWKMPIVYGGLGGITYWLVSAGLKIFDVIGVPKSIE